MKRVEGGWIAEPGDHIPIAPGTRKKIVEILVAAVAGMVREGRLKMKEGQIDWSTLPPPPPRRKPRKGQEFKVELFVPDPPAAK